MSQQRENNWEVWWDSPGFPAYYFGEWVIKKNGEEVQIPKEVARYHMGTYGTYVVEDNWELDGFVINGLKEDEWIQKNWYWLESICDSLEDAKVLYQKISEEDWR